MGNLVQNITADGNFQEVTNIPHECRFISMQARTAVDVQYHFKNQTTYWTVKSGYVRTIEGSFNNGDLFVQASNGVVIEMEFSTRGMLD